MQDGRVRDEKLVRDVHFHGGHVVMVSGLGDYDDHSATASPLQRPGGTLYQNEEHRELDSNSKCHVCL